VEEKIREFQDLAIEMIQNEAQEEKKELNKFK